MFKAENYISDSDESDEDFCPENEAEAESAEEESGVDEDQVEDNSDNSDNKERIKTNSTKADTAKTRKKKIKKINKNNTKNEISKQRPNTRQICESKGKSLSEKVTLESDEDDKTRTDALWADFLNDVKPTSKQENEEATNITSSSINDKGKPVDMTEQQSKMKTIQENTTESKDKLIVTEVMDFAGEEIRIQKQIDLNSSSSKKENRAALTATPKMQPFGRIMPGAGLKRQSSSLSGSSSSGSGLGTILNQIGKKKKLSVLEKTKLDWNSFKHDEGIAEELQTFNKGKDGYLERQDFLQRTDLRQFEIEKSLRHSRRNH
ncbi:craniofacial development protein 1 [Glossina fuscipes]|uniref:Craniofacial development protein 1 n=1 Tax=Glossina fuscipes TaxID=7396 RepID=A0A9C5Z500_9MUSC|nr:craniofacial development protein 1 [Glossina fuscipes]KAI9583255.1 hypothetical protein GQX74_012472 [Glossina fuscipes]